MIDKTALLERFRSAFEVEVPPGAALRLKAALVDDLHSHGAERTAGIGRRRPRRSPFAFRIGLRLAAGLVLIVLALSATAVFIATHHSATQQVPTTSGPKSHATARSGWGMVDPTTGWQETLTRDRYGIRHITRTTDAGAHWVDVTPSYLDNLTFADQPQTYESRYLLDANHVWLIEVVGSAGSQQLITLRTLDGGERWAEGEAITAAGSIPIMASLYFLDPMRGWLVMFPSYVGSGTTFWGALYGTSDGGLHWSQLASNPPHTPPDCSWWTGVAFASVMDGWLSDSCAGNLLVTHDGGTTWSSQAMPAAPAALNCPCSPGTPVVMSPTNAVAAIYGGTSEQPRQGVMITTNGGATWSVRALPGEVQTVVDFIDAKRGWTIAGPSDLLSKGANTPAPVPLYRTEDGGLTWSAVQTSLPLVSSDGRIYDMYFVDDKHGFAIRFSTATPSPILQDVQVGQLLKTTDGGQTWSVVGPTILN